MMTMSKPLSAGQAQRYHAEQFANAGENYYTEGQEVRGEWDGQLAAAWGLSGPVDAEHFHRLAEGQDPWSGAPLVKHTTPHARLDAQGHTVQTVEHRAGWDLTLSAPKSVSLAALVGGDDRVREAHRHAVNAALRATEPYTQARMGGDRPAQTTGQWVAAKFEHDAARPVDGYAAPQLHTHTVVFNMTRTESGATRSLQPRELYRTQQYATAVYRSELATRLHSLGYAIDRGASGQPELRGFTPEYLEASSPRRQQIEARLAEEGQRGAAAAQLAAIQTRETKTRAPRAEVRRLHQDLARAFDDQPARAVAAALQRQGEVTQTRADPPTPEHAAQHAAAERHAAATRADAVTYALRRNTERDAVPHERDYLRDALTRSMGVATVAEMHAEFEGQVRAGRFVHVPQPEGRPGRAYTTPEMIALEHRTVALMREGKNTQPPLIREETRAAIAGEFRHLAPDQRDASAQMFANRDRVQALEGIAGAGKTTTLAAVRAAAERDGYVVQGLAPTGRAAAELAKSGMPTTTLQRHLRQIPAEPAATRRLYVLDESSLASTTQMHDFLQRVRAHDRVLLVGDARQHQAVDAGKPYEQLQRAGLAVARLTEIKRQRDPTLREVVQRLSRGEVDTAVAQLQAQGRVQEIVDGPARLQAVASVYRAHPKGTLVVSPDNLSREQLNGVIRRELQAAGRVATADHRVRVLVPRQDLTGADRGWAGKYAAGDVVRYGRGSRAHGFEAGAYARVTHVDVPANRVTVTDDTQRTVTYDPRRLQGVMVYREAERVFAKGDRLQFTAPYPEQHITNRELGTIRKITKALDVEVRTDRGTVVTFNLDRGAGGPRHNAHVDHGYAVTSYSGQGQTADRVLVYLDSARAGEKLVNERFAYVAGSRGRDDLQIFTDDRESLAHALSRDVSKSSALERPAVARQEPTISRQDQAPAPGSTAVAQEVTSPHGAVARTPADRGFTDGELQRARVYLARPEVQVEVRRDAAVQSSGRVPQAIEPRHVAAVVRQLPPSARSRRPVDLAQIPQSPRLMVDAATRVARAEQGAPSDRPHAHAPRTPTQSVGQSPGHTTGHSHS
jgi:conjugative relaxase-like TrwC/TraI family protein